MDIESLGIEARERLDKIRDDKAAELKSQQENHARVYEKYERNKLFLERQLVASYRIEGLIIWHGVDEVFEHNGSYSRTLEYDSNRIPLQTGNDSTVDLFAVAWELSPRKGNVSILRRTVKSNSMPSSDTTLQSGVSIFAQDKVTGDKVTIKQFSITDIADTRKLLVVDDMDTIANIEKYRQDYYFNNINNEFTELEQVIGMIEQLDQTLTPVVS